MCIKIEGKKIQFDKSSVGNAWVKTDEDNCPQHIQDEIASEIIDGGHESCEDYIASNGMHYRW